MTLEFAGAGDSRLFRAGAGRAVITPPAGYPICGPEHPERISTGVADDLLAKVLLVESDGQRAALVGLDAWGLSRQLETAICDSVASAGGLVPGNVWVSVTGNGNSPGIWADQPAYARYAAYLPDVVAGAATIASHSLQPASISAAATRLPDVSTSIEGPGRPGDEALFVVAIDDADGSGIGRVVNFSCPATIVRPGADWTSDYPGYGMWAVEQGGGGLSLFAQGASADIRPFDWHRGNRTPSHAERKASDVQAFGLLLATQAARATAGAVPRRNAPVSATRDDDAGLNVLRIGPAVFVSSECPQPSRFARHIRRDLPGSTVIVSANRAGAPFGAPAELDHGLQKRAVVLARQIGAN